MRRLIISEQKDLEGNNYKPKIPYSTRSSFKMTRGHFHKNETSKRLEKFSAILTSITAKAFSEVGGK